ncbi:hypothetical protein BJ944DRAFT_276447, partial [Cunninghamella echinulata]
KINKGTTAHHVVKFTERTIDILDKQGKRGVYTIMDNCMAYHSEFVIENIKKHDYK